MLDFARNELDALEWVTSGAGGKKKAKNEGGYFLLFLLCVFKFKSE
jgi:hypothetical protein